MIIYQEIPCIESICISIPYRDLIKKYMHISKSNNILHLGYVVYFLLRENKHFLYQIPRRFYISILFLIRQERGDTRSLRSRSLSGARARLSSRK